MRKKKFIYIVLFQITVISIISAQSSKSLINEGVDLYKDGKFPEAEVNFKKGLEKDTDTFEGHFNLGDAYYKQGRYDEALNAFKSAYSLTDDDYRKSKGK